MICNLTFQVLLNHRVYAYTCVPMLLPTKLISRKDEITADFFKLVDQHMADLLQQKSSKRLSTRDFAALLFIDSRHLSNTLKLTTGKSPCDVMEERIVAEVKILLEQTGLPVAEIGYQFGYKDSTNFIKFFKGMTGITPLQYRKQIND